jgi:hypothetical protein
MGKQKSKDDPYSEIEEKIKKIMADIAEQMPKLSTNDLAVVQRAIKFLARKTRPEQSGWPSCNCWGPMKRYPALCSTSFAASV